jgi:divalent metal cation (Fe/Co/Zn/Cd) transporter
MRATYFAMIVSSILCITKFLNYFITNSVAIQASALDSLLDITVSFANFITIRFTQKKSNAKFPYGYDKIASLVAFLQVILVSDCC